MPIFLLLQTSLYAVIRLARAAPDKHVKNPAVFLNSFACKFKEIQEAQVAQDNI
jgi:hypothetical protein